MLRDLAGNLKRPNRASQIVHVEAIDQLLEAEENRLGRVDHILSSDLERLAKGSAARREHGDNRTPDFAVFVLCPFRSDRQIQRFFATFDRPCHRFVFRSLNHFDHFIRIGSHRSSVDRFDDIAGLEPYFLGRHPFHHLADLQVAGLIERDSRHLNMQGKQYERQDKVHQRTRKNR
ncbi:hypothetical protein D3C81_859930 [compost metagenome]